METTNILTFKEWNEQFQPLKNQQLNHSDSLNGTLFLPATVEDWQFVCHFSPSKIWSLVHDGNNSYVFISGYLEPSKSMGWAITLFPWTSALTVNLQ